MGAWLGVRSELFDLHWLWKELLRLREHDLIHSLRLSGLNFESLRECLKPIYWSYGLELTQENIESILLWGSPWFTKYTKPVVLNESRMAFETPFLSEPSRNGAKSTTFTMVLFCRLLEFIGKTKTKSWLHHVYYVMTHGSSSVTNIASPIPSRFYNFYS